MVGKKLGLGAEESGANNKVQSVNISLFIENDKTTSNEHSKKTSDKFITINNIHIYPIIISQDKKENYLNIIVHNKGPLYIF